MKPRRKEAIEAGDQYYFTGKECQYGHISKRQTADGSCYACRLENQKRERALIRAKHRAKAEQEASL
jgi:hypothetical protein